MPDTDDDLARLTLADEDEAQLLAAQYLRPQSEPHCTDLRCPCHWPTP